MPKTRVLITVKTYPTISGKYEELVCTAGFLEDGTWIRIYPVQFRKKSYDEQYKKYDWIEMDLVKNTSDFRPESYRPFSHDSEIKIVGHISPDGGSWDERRKFTLKKVHTNLTELIAEAKDKTIGTSLAVFKPKEIKEMLVEPCDREWDKEKLQALQQMNIFETVQTDKPKVVRKLPYKFSFRFIDNSDREATLMVEDWELGQLYWNCIAKYEGADREAKACNDVLKKYFHDFAKTKDIHFYLGTSLQFHNIAPNPFMIIGTFHSKHVKINPQGSLF
ncbi:MAG: hypothetical protein JST42_07920 [Bacteroidetes bacterium]|nr:hypothetical protein [Bacteroidota bacterium]